MKKYISSKELEQNVLKMYEKGMLDSEIERALGFPECTIYNFRKKLGLPSNKGKQVDLRSKEVLSLLRKGKTLQEISSITGLGKSALRAYFRRNKILDLYNVKKKYSYRLNQRQLSILCGILLGDGCISTYECKSGKYSCRFTVRHGPKQLLYSQYIYSCLQGANPRIFKVHIKEHYLKNKYIESEYQSEVRLGSSNQLEELYKSFYPNKKKVIPFPLLNKYYTKEALAFHFMDDGSKSCDSNGNINGFVFSLQGFTIEEVEHFKWFILGRFHLESSVILQKEKPILRISSKSVNTFINIVKPYIIDNLKYKISSNKIS